VRDIGIAADVWRYYLLSVRPEKGDSEFRWSDFAKRNKEDLVGTLGNFCHRVLDFVYRRCDGVIPEVRGAGLQECLDLGKRLQNSVDAYIERLEGRETRLREGLKAALEVAAIGNKFLTDHEPWKLIKTDPERAGTHLAAAAGVVRLLAALFSPFTPSAARLYLKFLGLDAEYGRLSAELLAFVCTPHRLVPPRHVLGFKPFPVFSDIDSSQVEALQHRFAAKVDVNQVARSHRRKQYQQQQTTAGGA
jgi:methionyl-tRNA synthetase